MACDRASTLRDALLGLLSDEEEAALRAHTATCPECAAALPWAPEPATAGRMAAGLEALLGGPLAPPEGPSPRAESADRAAAPSARTAPRSRPGRAPLAARLRLWPAIAAAALMLLCVGWPAGPAEERPREREPSHVWVPPVAASRAQPRAANLPEAFVLALTGGTAAAQPEEPAERW